MTTIPSRPTLRATDPEPIGRSVSDQDPAADAVGEVVVLVDRDDREVGLMPKIAAHENGGVLHRAFSLFVFDSFGRVLLQRRASSKYHFPGLWTNACCSHQRPGEASERAGARRAMEELGIAVKPEAVGRFLYESTCPRSGLTERELDHVLYAEHDGEVDPNPDEADAVRWVETDKLFVELAGEPGAFTPWFRKALGTLIATRFA